MHRARRWPRELQCLRLAPFGPRRREHLGERVGHEHVGLEAAHERDGPPGADDLATRLVADHHPDRQGVERLLQTGELPGGRVRGRQRARRGPLVLRRARARTQPHPNLPVM